MEHHVRFHAVGAAVVVVLGVAASLITSTFIASRSYEARGKQGLSAVREITVRGSARVRVRSDLGEWRIEVAGDGKDLAGAFAVLAQGIERVQAFVKARGFADAETSISPISTLRNHVRDKEARDTNQIESYTLERTVVIKSAAVDRIAAACGDVTALLKDNVRVTSRVPQFFFSKAADLKVRIVGEATQDARARADEMATRSGCKVADVRTVRMGVVQITQPDSIEVSSEGVYDTSTIDKDVSVVVSAIFGIEST